MSDGERLGDIVVSRGLVTRERLDEALARQRVTGQRLGEVLMAMGALTQEQLSWALSEALHIPFVELSEEVVDLDVARSLPEDVLRRHEAVPILRVGDELTVLLADPTDRQAAIEIEALTGARVTVALARRDAVHRFLDKAFPAGIGHLTGVGAPDANGHGSPPSDLSGVSQVFTLLLDAVREGASEVHVEPDRDGVVVRARLGDRLAERARYERALLTPIGFRLRVLAGLRGEAAPRVAHVRTQLEGRDIDLEMLFFPTVAGEAVTIRLRPAGAMAPTLGRLEVDDTVRAALAGLLGKPPGGQGAGRLVLVTGADARDRAEVLYALAQAASGPGRRTLTLERRAAFVVPDFLQVELPDDFPASAATVLSQRADVVLIEDVLPPAACAAALASAESGALVLGGMGLGSGRLALAHLAASDLRGPLLQLTQGVVNVRRGADAPAVEVVPLTPALRRDLVQRREPWTSPNC